MRYNKPAISIADQIQLLEHRGLLVPDHSEAKHYLSLLSYYRLAGYLWPLQSDGTNHSFTAGIDFSTIIHCCNVDHFLRKTNRGAIEFTIAPVVRGKNGRIMATTAAAVEFSDELFNHYCGCSTHLNPPNPRTTGAIQNFTDSAVRSFIHSEWLLF